MAQLYTILGVVAVLLVLSVFASKAAVKLGVPISRLDSEPMPVTQDALPVVR